MRTVLLGGVNESSASTGRSTTLSQLRHWLTFAGRKRPHLLGEILIVIFLVKIYTRIRASQDNREDAAVRNGFDILHVQSYLGMDFEKSWNLWLARHENLEWMISWWYEQAHIPATFLTLIACYWLRPNLYRPARNALVLTNVIGLTVFLVYPVAPPRLLPNSGFVDSVKEAGLGHTNGPVEANQFGAMPSLHLAWATWTAIVLICMSRYQWQRILAICYPLTVTLAVIITANHYVLDVFAGVAVTFITVFAAGLWVRFWAVRRTVPDEDDVPLVPAPVPAPLPASAAPPPAANT